MTGFAEKRSYTEDEVRKITKNIVAAEWCREMDFAEELRISKQYLSLFLRGERGVPDAVLEHFGLQRTVRFRMKPKRR